MDFDGVVYWSNMTTDEKLDDITKLLKALTDRLSVVEGKVEEVETKADRTELKGESKVTESVDNNPTETESRSQTAITGSEPDVYAVGPTGNVPGASHHDIYKEFESVKDSVARIALPPWLKIHDSQVGIKQEHKTALKILSKCARFTETGLKLISSFSKEENRTFILSEEDIGAIYTTLSAQAYYLQAEYSSLVVKSSFDDETSRLYTSLENNTSAFSRQSLNNVRIAAELAAISGRGRRRANPDRGRGQFGRGRGDYRGRDFRSGSEFYRGPFGGQGRGNINSP